MTTQAQTAINYYLSLPAGRSLSKDVAVGIVSVLAVESGLNPTAVNNSGTDAGGVLNPAGAYGLAQWNGPRQQALANFATSMKLDPSALDTQLHFVLTEAANSYPKVWAAINQVGMTYQNFIPIFVAEYEVPANQPAEVAKALANAEAWYSEVPTPQPVPVPTPIPSTNAVAIAQITDVIAILQSLLKTLGA